MLLSLNGFMAFYLVCGIYESFNGFQAHPEFIF
jgi:hypothetical protein